VREPEEDICSLIDCELSCAPLVQFTTCPLFNSTNPIGVFSPGTVALKVNFVVFSGFLPFLGLVLG